MPGGEEGGILLFFIVCTSKISDDITSSGKIARGNMSLWGLYFTRNILKAQMYIKKLCLAMGSPGRYFSFVIPVTDYKILRPDLCTVTRDVLYYNIFWVRILEAPRNRSEALFFYFWE